MAPMPSAVSVHGPRLFLSRCPGSSASEISLSMDFLANSWLASGLLPSPDLPCCKGTEPTPRPPLHYRFAWPRTSFFTLRLADPRA